MAQQLRALAAPDDPASIPGTQMVGLQRSDDLYWLPQTLHAAVHIDRYTCAKQRNTS